MASTTLPVRTGTPATPALRTGIALAVTAAAFYTLCALIWLAAPAAFLGFMNSLFHGIDFSPLVHPGGFVWTGFLEALSVLSVWAFLAGTCFAWLRRLLGD